MVKHVFIGTERCARQIFKHAVPSRVPRGISEHSRSAPDPNYKY